MNPVTVPSVTRLRDAVADARFDSHAEAQNEARDIVAQLDDYILPRLSNVDAPLLAVVGGSTGSGKSTLVNAIVGREVTVPGVIRPTTRRPVLVTHPDDEAWFRSDNVLAGLTSDIQVTATDAVHPGLALVDAPDFDSIEERNREVASQLLAAADLWVFATTPTRYADQLVWNFLHDAAGRDLEVVVILNRMDTDAAASVPDDLRRMMAEAGLTDATLFTVADAGHIDGRLATDAVSDIRGYLEHLAVDAASRREVAARTVAGAVGKLTSRVEALAAERDRLEELESQLSAGLDAIYDDAARHVIDATSDGKLLRHEVLQRWQDIVGTSDFSKTIECWYAQATSRIGSFLTGKPAPMREVEVEIEDGLHAVLIDSAESAAARSWSYLGGSAPLLRAAADPTLAQAAPGVSERASQVVREWQAQLVETIQNTAGDKRKQARIISLGLNVVTVALMLVVFASTAGLTGGELAIAGGSAVLAQRLLETVFGEENVRRMAAQAREDLAARTEAFLESERTRFDAVTEPLVAGTRAAELRDAVESI
ncbi:GTPase domain-containing protein [Corynebacterium doosanense]|uniref:ABC transporter n=1 Tax=Corynebacterium doosanense CAU 212 = DSM 45436 TaxID=558173 RepID=A0A097IDU6_9CORY|nr:GTPase domain-containing protein [Corynebacterium doosanense]AIT60306.1 ABC transporter [Corynebacterium doosanense CAU 212 = DSM 45436]